MKGGVEPVPKLGISGSPAEKNHCYDLDNRTISVAQGHKHKHKALRGEVLRTLADACK